jgi:hypothetical protein
MELDIKHLNGNTDIFKRRKKVNYMVNFSDTMQEASSLKKKKRSDKSFCQGRFYISCGLVKNNAPFSFAW